MLRPTFTKEVLDQLRRSGFRLSDPHSFDFYLYLRSQQAAHQVNTILVEHGFESEIRPGADGNTWLCRARKTLVPSTASLDDIAALFDTLSEAHGGEFDGWEAAPAP